jgi:diguanylate cyclase (GGDEF)-like protein
MLDELGLRDIAVRARLYLVQLYILNQQFKYAEDILKEHIDDFVHELSNEDRFDYFIYKADLFLSQNQTDEAHTIIQAAENLKNTHEIRQSDEKLGIRWLKLAIQISDEEMVASTLDTLEKANSKRKLSADTEIQMLNAKAFFLAKQGAFQEAYEWSNRANAKKIQLMERNIAFMHEGTREFSSKIAAREQIHAFRRVEQEKEQNLVLFQVILAGVLGVTFIVSVLLVRNRKLASEMKELATHDELTTLKNRRFGMLLINETLNITSRSQDKMAIGILDIDNFKKINDTFGHLFGDEVLKVISQCFKDNLRNSDILLRYGGEEFIVAMPNTSYSQSLIFFDRLRESVNALSVSHADQKVNLSISVGVTETDGSEHIESVIKRADDALYAAKGLGKDRVEGKVL